jgi:hypothetical protein
MENIFILDPDFNNCLLLKEMLEAYDSHLKISTYCSAIHGLEAMKEKPPDIVFIEESMINLAFDHICNLPVGKSRAAENTAYVLLSPLNIIDIGGKGHIRAVLMKPYNVTDLYGILDKIKRAEGKGYDE